MAVCKRCGKSFDYNKREGVCPKCCFYNRPEGSWQEDTSWVKNYNYEDNSYDYTASEVMPDSTADTIFGTIRENAKHREVSGSHKHLSDGSIVKGLRATTKKPNGPKPTGGKKKSSPGCMGVGIVLVVFYMIICAIMSIVSSFF